MEDTTILFIGIFVTLLLLSGVFYTMYEFKKMYHEPD